MLNEIVASQIVSVPASNVYQAARKLKFLVLGIVGAIFIVGDRFNQFIPQKLNYSTSETVFPR